LEGVRVDKDGPIAELRQSCSATNSKQHGAPTRATYGILGTAISNILPRRNRRLARSGASPLYNISLSSRQQPSPACPLPFSGPPALSLPPHHERAAAPPVPDATGRRPPRGSASPPPAPRPRPVAHVVLCAAARVLGRGSSRIGPVAARHRSLGTRLKSKHARPLATVTLHSPSGPVPSVGCRGGHGADPLTPSCCRAKGGEHVSPEDATPFSLSHSSITNRARSR
jgi:hypothetical protein